MAHTRKRSGKNQRGGSDDIVIPRYTSRPARIEWITTTYPLGNVVINAIKNIKWDSYKYEGDGYGEIHEESEIMGGPSTIYPVTGQMVATCPKIPYCIIGGAACELWNKNFPKVADLHKTTEPTADIDITISKLDCAFTKESQRDIAQKVLGKDKLDTEISLFVLKDDTYTSQYDHFTRWLYEEAKKVARTIQFAFPDTLFEAPHKREMSETHISDLSETIGPILVSRVITENKEMIKVQLSTKLTKGTKHADHFVEFIIITDPNYYLAGDPGNGDFSTTALKFDNVFIKDPFFLLNSQNEAIEGRKEADDTIRYKLLNHYGRVLYLAKLCKYTAANTSIIKTRFSLIEGNFKGLLKPVLDGHFASNPSACSPKFGCSAAEYLAPLCDIHAFKSRCAKPDIQAILYPASAVKAASPAKANSLVKAASPVSRSKTLKKSLAQWWQTSTLTSWFRRWKRAP
jgi:hypothetical protein